MKHVISLFLIISLVLSCTSNTIYKKPDDLIQKEVMIELIGQMQIANSARSSKNINNERSLEYMALVYEKFGVDSAQFARSNFYYSTKIDDYKKIMQQVKLDLNQLKEVQEAIIKESDSIKREESKAKRKLSKDIKKRNDSLKLNDADALVK